MNYDSVHDISCRLAKQLKLGVSSNKEIILEVLNDLLRSCQGRIVESKRILGSIAKLTHVRDFRVKKLVYLYLSFTINEGSETWLHVLNSVLNDSIDPNPSIRKSSLVFLTDSHSISDSVNDVRVEQIAKCLKDPNPGVRKCAVAGIAKLTLLYDVYKVDVDMSGILDNITQMIYQDDDPTVIVECIYCLKTCKKQSLKFELLLSLLERMEMVEVWTKAEIVNLFLKVVDPYKMSHDQIFKVLNLVDPYLDHKFPIYLRLCCATAMLLVSKRFSNIHADVKTRVLDHLITKSSLIPGYMKVLHFAVMNVVVDKSAIARLVKYYRQYIPLPSDGQFTKVLKLQLLRKVCTKENASHVFKVATSIAMTACEKELIHYAMGTLLSVRRYLPRDCVGFLLNILKHDSSAVVNASVFVLWKMVFSSEEVLELDGDALADALILVYDKLSSPDAKSAFFSFMCLFAQQRHAEQLKNILELEADSWASLRSQMFKLVLLRASATLYFLSPGHFHFILGKILLLGSKDNNLLINRQAFMYYDHLRNDVETAKKYFLDLAKLKHPLSTDVHPQIDKLSSLCLITFESG